MDFTDETFLALMFVDSDDEPAHMVAPLRRQRRGQLTLTSEWRTPALRRNSFYGQHIGGGVKCWCHDCIFRDAWFRRYRASIMNHLSFQSTLSQSMNMLRFLAVSLIAARVHPRLPHCAVRLIFSYLDKGLWHKALFGRAARDSDSSRRGRRAVAISDRRFRNQLCLESFFHFSSLVG